MSNFYTLLSLIEDLNNSKNLSIAQHKFLSETLNEKNLAELARPRSEANFNDIKNKIQSEYKNNSYLSLSSPYVNFYYKSGLGALLKNISALQQHRSEIKTLSKNKTIYEYTRKIDQIFSETENIFHGKVILPVQQYFDSQYGDSNGECLGYTVEWLVSILSGRKAFGIDLKNLPDFRPIKLNSSAGEKYMDLNHLARLTKKISDYQLNQTDLLSFMQQSSDPALKEIHYKKQNSIHFYKSVRSMAENLTLLASIGPNHWAYQISLYGYMSGHALGFAKIDGKYHFFDSNSGWYRFNRAIDFDEWLPFYFKKMTYDKVFLETSLSIFSTKPMQDESKSEPLPAKKTLQIIATAIILSPIILPIIAIYSTYFLGVRGCIYGINNLLNISQSVFKWFTNNKDHTKNEFHNAALEKKNNDAAVIQKMNQSHTSPSLPTSYSRIHALLDIPVKKIMKVSSKAAKNPEFKSSRKLKPKTNDNNLISANKLTQSQNSQTEERPQSHMSKSYSWPSGMYRVK